MDNIKMIDAISGGIFAVVGILLTLWGSKAFGKRMRLGWRISLGALLTGLGIFILSLSRPEFGNALIVLATLILAFAAFWSVKTSTEHESLIRSEDRELEFKRRSLAEVTQWLKNTWAALSKPSEITYISIQNERRNLESLEFESYVVLAQSRIFGLELESAIRDTQKHLGEYIKLLPTTLDLLPKPIQEKIHEKIGELIPPSDYKDPLTIEVASKIKESVTALGLSIQQALQVVYKIKGEQKL